MDHMLSPLTRDGWTTEVVAMLFEGDCGYFVYRNPAHPEYYILQDPITRTAEVRRNNQPYIFSPSESAALYVEKGSSTGTGEESLDRCILCLEAFCGDDQEVTEQSPPATEQPPISRRDFGHPSLPNISLEVIMSKLLPLHDKRHYSSPPMPLPKNTLAEKYPWMFNFKFELKETPLEHQPLPNQRQLLACCLHCKFLALRPFKDDGVNEHLVRWLLRQAHAVNCSQTPFLVTLDPPTTKE